MTTTDTTTTRRRAPGSKRRGRRARHPLSPEQERDLLLRYVTTDEPILAIARRFEVPETYPYRVLERHKIDWRRGHTEAALTFAQWVQDHNRTDLATFLGFSQDASQPMATARAERAPDKEPEKERPVPDLPLEIKGPNAEWVVELTERISVSARSIEGALDEARKLRRNGRITGIRLRETER